MKDFTPEKYGSLLEAFLSKSYCFQTFEEFLKSPKERVIVLRHDVDKQPENSLCLAKMEHDMGILGSYYFRANKCSWNEEIIKEISSMGHEIGYHYENLSVFNGNIEKAYNDFLVNLEKLREMVPVKTICMHGSPSSKWDSKDLWKYYNYKKLELIGEPYFDVDYDSVFYLTDTGRRWDGWKYSVRDKVPQQEKWIKEGLVFKSTDNIIESILDYSFPSKVMITIHPQRWQIIGCQYFKEYLLQGLKNNIKKYFFVKR